MNNIKILILSLFISINIFAMQQPKTLGDLPKDIWIKIADFGVDRTGKTEADIFKNIDSLRLTSKKNKSAIDQLISTVAIEKGKNPKTYTYADFKADIIDEIIKLRRTDFSQSDIDNFVILKLDDPEIQKQLAKITFDLEAINWLKVKLKGRKLNLLDLTAEVLRKVATMDPKKLELWMLLGIDPNAYVTYDSVDYVDYSRDPHMRYTTVIDVEEKRNALYFMLGALATHLEYNYDKKTISLSYIDKWITNLKILLNHGLNPKNIIGATPPNNSLINMVVLVLNRLGEYDYEKPARSSIIEGSYYYSGTQWAKYLLEAYWRDYVLRPKEKSGYRKDSISTSEYFKNKLDYSSGKTNNDPIIPKLQEIVKILEEAEKKAYYGTL